MKKGISLIVLVITIIIMIIISTTTIINLSDSNAIEKSKEAVEKYNLSSVEQIANMSYYNVYFNNLTKNNRREVTVDELKEEMLKEGLDEETIDKYNFVITNGDIVITLKEK